MFKSIKDAVVNLFKSLSGLVARELKSLEDRVKALEGSVAQKIQDQADKLNQQ
jgi:hypothetical protein